MKTLKTNRQKQGGSRISWLGIDEQIDDFQYVNVETMQEKELEAKIGIQLNLWLEYMIAKRDIL